MAISRARSTACSRRRRTLTFIQTWNDDKKAGPLNPKTDDYAVFLATSEKPGKDNSGDYVYVYDDKNAPKLDNHNHMIVDHDLDDIAAAFAKWGKEQGLVFCEGDE